MGKFQQGKHRVSSPSQAISGHPPLDRFWLCEAVRLREERGERLEDREANRQARASGGGLQQRIYNTLHTRCIRLLFQRKNLLF